MDASDLRHAYAVLSLSPPVTEDGLKQRYKALVRRWHPDRYESDPAGQAEATTRLRNINLAYEIVAASLEPVEPQQEHEEEEVVPPTYRTPTYQTERSPYWSPEQIDAIVDSMNRENSFTLVPEMTVHRWYSLGALAAYLVLLAAVLPALGHPDIAVLIFPGAIYSILPLYLIWKGDDGSLTPIPPILFRIVGWLFMAAPAIILLVLWIIGTFETTVTLED